MALILVLDDEPANRKLFGWMLASGGHQVLQASDGDSAVRLFESQPTGVDLLITDVMLAGKDGHQVAVTLRRLRPNLPIVLISGYTAEALEYAGIRIGELGGHCEFVQKPFKAAELLAAIERLLQGRTRAAGHGSR